MRWEVLETKSVAKQLRKLPNKIKYIYVELVSDLENEGYKPKGWDILLMKGRIDEYRVKLTREYRVIMQVISPRIIVLKVVYRKEAYR